MIEDDIRTLLFLIPPSPSSFVNLDTDGRLLSVGLQGVSETLSTDARHLASSEGHVEVPDQPTVCPDGSNAKSGRDAVDDADVFGPDGGAKAVFDIVGSFDHFIFRLLKICILKI